MLEFQQPIWAALNNIGLMSFTGILIKPFFNNLLIYWSLQKRTEMREVRTSNCSKFFQ